LTIAVLRKLSVFAALGAVLLLSACGWFGGDSGKKSESVFSVKPGQCFVAPKDVKAQLSKLARVDCSESHTQEAYALVTFAAQSGGSTSAYPGSDQLSTFAKGACAQRFGGYVGVDYLDSDLYFTYLLPSARSWEQDNDRTIICFVTATGGTLSASVKGSKK
jgi:hypothetical protein